MASEITEYGKKYRKKREDEGYVFMKVLIPKVYREKVLAYAHGLREYYKIHLSALNEERSKEKQVTTND